MGTPVNASPASLRTQAHDSEPKWCATPFLCGSLIRYSLPVYPGAFLDHLIRPRKKLWRKCQPNLFRSLQVDDELELRCLLHWQIGRLGTSENLIHVTSRTAVEVNVVHSIGHETALIDICPLVINRGQAVFVGKFNKQTLFGEKISGGSGHNGANLFLLRRLKSFFN